MYTVTRVTIENIIIPVSIALLKYYWIELIQIFGNFVSIQEQFALAPKEIVVVIVNYRL